MKDKEGEVGKGGGRMVMEWNKEITEREMN